ncbi:hypothetical protein DQP55_24025 [Mycolicibacterium sp. GF69]|nr:hypothetical protein DQP55_24025 [Mycolicibacterium sp. GF69]
MRLAAATALSAVCLGVQGCNFEEHETAEASPSDTASVRQSVAPATPIPTVSEPKHPPAAPSATGWETVGTSVQGRPIRALTVGRGARKVLFIGGIHGDEPEGSVTTTELPAAFEAAGLAESVTLTILEDANPDGRAVGARGNAKGVDVNRNFPAKNFDTADPSSGGQPASEPEARAIIQTVDRIGPALILVAHSWAGRQFINFDGPAREIAERFSEASGLLVEESSSFAPTPGSLGSYFGRDRGIAVLTIEVLKGSDPRAVWDRLRPALLRVIGG